MTFNSLSDREEYIAERIVDAAFTVHKALGPGLLINFNVPVMRNGIKRIIV